MSEEKIKELLEETCNKVKVHTPTLDYNLKPKAELLNMSCPKGKDGVCHECEHFMGFLTEDHEGRMASYFSYDGFCLKEAENPKTVKDKLNKLIANQQVQRVFDMLP